MAIDPYDYDGFWRRYNLRNAIHLTSKVTMLGICGYCCAAEGMAISAAFFFFLVASELFDPRRLLMKENIKVMRRIIEINRRLWDGISDKGKD